MSGKILVPLDGSLESEGIFDALREELSLAEEVILVQVIPPAKTYHLGEYVLDASQQEESGRSRAMSYLRDAVRRLGGDKAKWRCEVAVGESVSRAIVGFAQQEDVDFIAMYTHDRKGLARFIKGSIARDVQRRANVDVRVFGPRELVGAA